MSDREKIIEALECCTTVEDCMHCPYDEYHGKGCFQKLMKDALVLLKREPVEPIKGEDMEEKEKAKDKPERRIFFDS